MRANLERRVEALECAAGGGAPDVLVVGPYPYGADPAPHVAQAQSEWVARHRAPPPPEEFHIHIRGVKPAPRAKEGAAHVQ